MKNVYKKMKPISKDLSGIRDALFDEYNLLREGKSTVSRMNAVAKITQQLLYIFNSNLEVRQIEKKK